MRSSMNLPISLSKYSLMSQAALLNSDYFYSKGSWNAPMTGPFEKPTSPLTWMINVSN